MITVLVLIGVLILANGFFVAMEMALVTARRTRLEIKAKDGDHKATQVLAVQDQPGDFLATVQIGITLVGTAASAVGGAGIVRGLSPFIARVSGLAPYSDSLALALVIITIAYLTLVFGELVPKRLALRNAEDIAMAFTSPLRILSHLTHLPMRVLTFSTDIVLKLIGSTGTQHPSTSPEEIELLVKQGVAEGVIQFVEESLISGIFDYTERRVQDVMTPRTSIIALDEKITPAKALRIAKQSGYSRFPVYSEDLDCIVGYVHIKDVIWAKNKPDLSCCVREVQFIPSGASLPDAFNKLTLDGSHIGIILDEHGGTRGLLTLEDMLEEIVGEIEDEHSPIAEQIERKTEGEWVFAGTTPVSEVGELLGIDFQPRGVYTTLAGFILASLGKIPESGDKTSQYGYVFSVMEMDHLRIVSIHVQRSLFQSTE
jgi:putative hemolysin